MPADSYAPTFDPQLSGRRVGTLLDAARAQRAYSLNQWDSQRDWRTSLLTADRFEFEVEERWLFYVASQVCRIRSDGTIHAPFLGTAWRSFSGQGQP